MTVVSEPMRQEAPYPEALRDLVARLDYKGWDVYLADLDRGQGSKGLTLVITREGPDTYKSQAKPGDRVLLQGVIDSVRDDFAMVKADHAAPRAIPQRHDLVAVQASHPDRVIRVDHYMPVPAAAFNEASWRRWLFAQFLLVERHECAEYFKIGGERPYAPNHGHGEDPYIIHDPTTDEARRTSFRNVLDDDGTGRPKRM